MTDVYKEYIGDSVYVSYDHGRGLVTIYTDNGYGPQNEIYLDDPILVDNMMKFLEKTTNDRP